MIPKSASINDAERMYRNGTATEAEVIEYLRAWNAGPYFSQAVLADGRIRLFDPEKSGFAYKRLQEKFGLKL
jgi:hypothetical protein